MLGSVTFHGPRSPGHYVRGRSLAESFGRAALRAPVLRETHNATKRNTSARSVGINPDSAIPRHPSTRQPSGVQKMPGYIFGTHDAGRTLVLYDRVACPPHSHPTNMRTVPLAAPPLLGPFLFWHGLDSGAQIIFQI
jgi:hypothetical protein